MRTIKTEINHAKELTIQTVRGEDPSLEIQNAILGADKPLHGTQKSVTPMSFAIMQIHNVRVKYLET